MSPTHGSRINSAIFRHDRSGNRRLSSDFDASRKLSRKALYASKSENRVHRDDSNNSTSFRSRSNISTFVFARLSILRDYWRNAGLK